MKNVTTTEFRNKAVGFNTPTQVPRNDEQRGEWQAANKSWWETSPMRYDWREPISDPPGTKAYFREIDNRFLSSVAKYMPWRNIPFDDIIPFPGLRDKDVLEIGVGQGTHAQLIAPRSRSYTGIDLTNCATEMTSQRLRLFGLPGQIIRMDAEEMAFPNGCFDFIWSWGVIHHSSDTRRVLREMHRTLRAGATSIVMVYHRSWWNYYVFNGILKRVAQKDWRRKTLHHATQAATDGAIARYYTINEWKDITKDLFEIEWVRVYGLKSELIPLPRGSVKAIVDSAIPDGFARLFTNKLHMGSFLVSRLRRKAA